MTRVLRLGSEQAPCSLLSTDFVNFLETGERRVKSRSSPYGSSIGLPKGTGVRNGACNTLAIAEEEEEEDQSEAFLITMLSSRSRLAAAPPECFERRKLQSSSRGVLGRRFPEIVNTPGAGCASAQRRCSLLASARISESD